MLRRLHHQNIRMMNIEIIDGRFMSVTEDQNGSVVTKYEDNALISTKKSYELATMTTTRAK